MANGVWAASVLAQAKLVGAKFGERRPRERALNAVTNHYQCKDGRWLILSLLNEDRQWPTLARCLGREDLVTDPRFEAKKERHARSITDRSPRRDDTSRRRRFATGCRTLARANIRRYRK
jgi:formyl-CoA transferase